MLPAYVVIDIVNASLEDGEVAFNRVGCHHHAFIETEIFIVLVVHQRMLAILETLFQNAAIRQP